MDIKYANERIDFITKQVYEAKRIYDEISDMYNTEQYDYNRIENRYYDATSAIKEYYEYLEKVNVNPRDSYLTAWLREEGHDILDRLEGFLHGQREGDEDSNFPLIFNKQKQVKAALDETFALYKKIKWEESISPEQHQTLKTSLDTTYKVMGDYSDYIHTNIPNFNYRFFQFLGDVDDDLHQIYDFLIIVSLKSSE
jgi:hypothetical protein